MLTNARTFRSLPVTPQPPMLSQNERDANGSTLRYAWKAYRNTKFEGEVVVVRFSDILLIHDQEYLTVCSLILP